MKHLHRAGFLGGTLMAAAIVTAMPAAAHTVRSRPASGTIETLDVGARTVKFSPTSDKAPTELALTRQTIFIHNWHFVPASELKPGTLVVVYYRTPLIGRPFVTKVVWVNEG
jgi:hypothetical protein